MSMPNTSVHDLHYWELVFVQLYRWWRREGPTKAEHRIVVDLKDERIYPLVDSLFRLFEFLERVDANIGDTQNDELSHAEVLLLELVSCDGDRRSSSWIFLMRNRHVSNLVDLIAVRLIRAGIFVRNIHDMALSEEEQLDRKIANSYQVIFRMDGLL